VRAPKDRDFVETAEGFFFCLVGYLHPPDRYTAYLKYTPSDRGRWARGDVFYRRELAYYHVRNVMQTIEFLEREYPRYVWLDPVQSLRFSFVPRDAVTRYYVPEERLVEIVRTPRDPLEVDVAALVDCLGRLAGLAVDCFAITGSVLLELHNPAFSDIDLLVYGRDNAVRLKEALRRPRSAPFADLEPARLARWRVEAGARFSLSDAVLRDLERRRWNHFLFRGRYVSVHPTRCDPEIGETYGSRRYLPLGPAAIEGTVADATESLFLPAVYRLTDVRLDDGRSLPQLELASYEGLFSDAADPGDRVRAQGALEKVNGTIRLVVGTAAVSGGGSLWRIAFPLPSGERPG
jgi:predicted nucleotidyltransferase